MDNKHLDTPLSNYDLMRGISNELKERANIVDTQDLSNYKNVDELFNNSGHAILFEPPEDPAKSDVGHWVFLGRSNSKYKQNPPTGLNRTNKGNCIYFDSYGGKLKNPQLRKLLNTEYDEIQYNPHQFQGYGTSVCGRYALACATLNKIIPDLNVKHIVDFLKSKPKNISFDKFILDITGKI